MGSVGLAPRLVQLRWADRCAACDCYLPEFTEARWDPRTRVVTCQHCSPDQPSGSIVASIWTATLPTASDPDLRIDLSNRLDAGSQRDDSMEFHWTVPTVDEPVAPAAVPVLDDQAIRAQLAEVELADAELADVELADVVAPEAHPSPSFHIAS